MQVGRKVIPIWLAVAVFTTMAFLVVTASTLEEGLIAYYPFNGNANDESGNNHHGTVYGATLATARFGNPNSAYSFDGIDDYMEIPDHVDFNFGIGGFTVSLWIKTDATTTVGFGRDDILAKGDPTGSGYAISTRNNRAAFLVGYSGGCYGSSLLNDGEWHHIVGTRDDSNNILLYVDNVVECTGTNNENVDTDYKIFIGKHGTKNESYFDGLIDDVRIYNRAVAPHGVYYEDFDSEPFDFSEEPYFSVSNGRLFFHGDRSDGVAGVIWVGGSNPGGEYPLPENSNYFENFKVSVDTNWEGGTDNYPYGLAVCTQENMAGTTDNIHFAIDKKGSYLIGKRQNGERETIVDWKKSSLIATSGQNNNLSIKKVGPYFHFYINEIEVARRIIAGFHGGGVGVWGNHQVDASFDNFAVTKLSASHIETDSNDVFEDFNTGSGSFSECAYFSALNGRFVFRGDRSDYTHFHAWVGGFNPGGLDPQPHNSNYFENFTISVDTYWEGGAENYVYGLKACMQENSLETTDSVKFNITGDGWYRIAKYEDGVFGKLVDWTASGHINTGGQKNNLSMQKNGSQFHFYINDIKVQQLTISGFPGGAVGVEASQYVDVSFDNFSVTIPGTAPTADAGADQTINEGDAVTLSGSNSSDPDDGIYSYQWYQITGPPITLSESTVVQPIFTAPDIGPDGVSLTFQLTVTDHSRLHSSDICVVNVNWVGAKGDIDKNDFVDLADAIIGLQVLSGMNPTAVRSDYTSSNADVNGDGKVGLEEVVYVLQKVAGIR